MEPSSSQQDTCPTNNEESTRVQTESSPTGASSTIEAPSEESLPEPTVDAEVDSDSGSYETIDDDSEASYPGDTSSGNKQSDKLQERPDGFGCEHYWRRCRIVCPTCGEDVPCRICHDESKEHTENAHQLNRQMVEEVICSACSKRQPKNRTCTNCNIIFAEYYCEICSFWDNHGEEKRVFHCDGCNLCRVGGRENYFHCDKCICCLPLSLRDTHTCFAQTMHRPCPICLEYMFDSRSTVNVLLCGHTVHSNCWAMLQKTNIQSGMRCPMCNKSTGHFQEHWKQIDWHVKNNPVPEDLQRTVNITCNDCNKRSQTDWHQFGLKCAECGSYNTAEL